MNGGSGPLLSIIIPCYNEVDNLPILFEQLSSIISESSLNLEVVFVNNGSTDDSKAVFEKLSPAYNFAKIVEIEVNEGYGHGIYTGLKAGTGEFLGWTHADLQTDLRDILKAYKILEKNKFSSSIYVKGNRKSRPIVDQIFTFGMSVFETFLFGTFLSDVFGQPNIIHRSFLSKMNNPPKDYSWDIYTYALAKKNNIIIQKFPVYFLERIHGKSSWNSGFMAKFPFIGKIIKSSLKLKSKV